MNQIETARAIGQFHTPFYVFDIDLLTEQVKKIRAAFNTEVDLCYAMKANPFIVKELEDLVDFFEVCSPGEFHICEQAGIDMGKIVLSGVYKDPADIEDVISTYGGRILYTAESFQQLRFIEKYAGQYRVPVRVLLRLTSGNQFGIDKTIIRDIIANRPRDSLVTIEGLQFFSGTQKKAPDRLEKELHMLDALCADLQTRYSFPIKKLEYGPGLPIHYFADEQNMEDRMASALAGQLKNLTFGGKVVLEMGRFIAAPCGYYVTSVVDMKINKKQSYCIVDGGIHHLNYFGQMMAMKKPPVAQWQKNSGEEKEWTVCGSLCTVNDVLVRQFPFAGLQLGDKLIFKKVGAYSVTEGMSLFLSRELPQVILFSKQSQFRIARNCFPTETLNYFQK